jgi:hypothetical protein
MMFQVLDKAEEEFAFDDAAPFEGLEGEATLRIDPRALRKLFRQPAQTVLDRLFGFGRDEIRTVSCVEPWSQNSGTGASEIRKKSATTGHLELPMSTTAL